MKSKPIFQRVRVGEHAVVKIVKLGQAATSAILRQRASTVTRMSGGVLILFILGVLFTSSNFAEAQTASELQAQIQALQQQIAQLNGSATAQPFNQNLYFGLRNNADVRRLQDFLIGKGLLAASLNTGNYFSATQAAVRLYQSSHGLPATGYFGPLTRARVNAEIALTNQIGQVQGELNLALKQQATPVVMPTPPPPSPPASAPPANSALTQARYDLVNIANLIHADVNQQRINNGLPALIWDDTLSDMARLHSEDQAQDNIEITNPNILCQYPEIRHEGIRGGYSVTDRLAAENINNYRAAGENIVMFSGATNLYYSYDPNNPPPPCPTIMDYPSETGPASEKIPLWNEVISEARAAVQGMQTVTWVRKDYLTEDQIAAKAVELWMNSPGHRENILRSAFNYGGIGIAPVNEYLIITQDFLGR